MAYYRTYRPQVIEEIDNGFVRKRLESLLRKKPGELPHAYLLTGPKGAGKTTAARILAKLYNCPKKKKNGAPCGTCSTCTDIRNGTHLDIIEIDAASNRGIDEMRLLRERIGLSPVAGGFTVYIIDEVHMLTTEAANALLKTLEEPPPHAVFILATTDPEKIPVTVVSRCFEIRFGKASAAELRIALDRIVTREKLQVEDDALSYLAEIADGSFREAVKYLEQVALEGGKITSKTVSDVISVGGGSEAGAILGAALAGDTKQAVNLVSKMAAEGKNMRVLLTQISRLISGQLVSVVTNNPGDSQTAGSLVRLSGLLNRAFSGLRLSPVPELPVLEALVSFSLDSGTHEKPPAGPSQVVPVKKSLPQDAAPAEDGPGLHGNLTLQKLLECWPDVISELKIHNHSLAGIMRSSRPKSVSGGTVTVEAFYKFHRDKLTEPRSLDSLTMVLKKLFGEKVKVGIVLGKK